MQNYKQGNITGELTSHWVSQTAPTLSELETSELFLSSLLFTAVHRSHRAACLDHSCLFVGDNSCVSVRGREGGW